MPSKQVVRGSSPFRRAKLYIMKALITVTDYKQTIKFELKKDINLDNINGMSKLISSIQEKLPKDMQFPTVLIKIER